MYTPWPIEKKKVFIAAITIPTPSKKYLETSCTAGIDENGNWLRLYPVPLRKMEANNQEGYRKYEWIEVDTLPSLEDKRPESRKIVQGTIHKLGKRIGTEGNWQNRKDIIFKSKPKIYFDFDELLKDADRNNIKVSLALFKPTEVIDCIVTNRDMQTVENEISKQEILRNTYTPDLFEDAAFIQSSPMLLDVKYSFSDIKGKKHTMTIIDWEVYELFRKYYYEKNKSLQDLVKAKSIIKEKYGTEFIREKDLYFILGSRKEDHLRGYGKNPFSIIGLFYPKKDNQLQLF